MIKGEKREDLAAKKPPFSFKMCVFHPIGESARRKCIHLLKNGRKKPLFYRKIFVIDAFV